MLGFAPLAVGPLGWIPSSAPPSGEVTGSAAATMGGLGLSANASASMRGAAASMVQPLALSSSAGFTISGAGSATFGQIGAALVGTMAFGAAGASAVGSLALAGAGGFTIVGSGAAQMAGFGLSASGIVGSFVIQPPARRISINTRARNLSLIASAKPISLRARPRKLSLRASFGNGELSMEKLPSKHPLEEWMIDFRLDDWVRRAGRQPVSFNVEVESGAINVANARIEGGVGWFELTGGARRKPYALLISADFGDGVLFADVVPGYVL